MNPRRETNGRRRRNIALVAVALLAVAAATAWHDRAVTNAPREVIAADFPGEIASGGPVYRLPSVRVVAMRRDELARIEREERVDRARDAQARTAQQPST